MIVALLKAILGKADMQGVRQVGWRCLSRFFGKETGNRLLIGAKTAGGQIWGVDYLNNQSRTHLLPRREFPLKKIPH
ncbi:MAG: hypothetical protein OEZ05_15685, partial [Nitrospirota bacterium]|nr:hypothetical protein [Nitrospirota bacterium]